jgi:hypothetical protein
MIGDEIEISGFPILLGFFFARMHLLFKVTLIMIMNDLLERTELFHALIQKLVGLRSVQNRKRIEGMSKQGCDLYSSQSNTFAPFSGLSPYGPQNDLYIEIP